MNKIIETGDWNGEKIWREQSAEEKLLEALKAVSNPEHECTSSCNKDRDCPLCEHGKLVCEACGDEPADEDLVVEAPEPESND